METCQCLSRQHVVHNFKCIPQCLMVSASLEASCNFSNRLTTHSHPSLSSISSLVWHACGSHFTRTESVPISSSCAPFSMTFELCQGCSVKSLFAGAGCSKSKDPGSPTKQKNLQVAKSSRGVGNFIANRLSKRNTKINSSINNPKISPTFFFQKNNERRSDGHAKLSRCRRHSMRCRPLRLC